MGKPKPTAGYPSRTDACLTLRAQGLDNRQIADSLDIDICTVSALLITKLKRAAPRAPGPDPLHQNGTQVWVSNDILDALALHAARRALSTEALITAVLGAVIDDKLVDVVLDDAADLPSPSQQVPA